MLDKASGVIYYVGTVCSKTGGNGVTIHRQALLEPKVP